MSDQYQITDVDHLGAKTWTLYDGDKAKAHYELVRLDSKTVYAQLSVNHVIQYQYFRDVRE